MTDIDGEVLCVSQFTLLAATRKGSKPDFHAAMGAEQSRQAYEGCLDQLGKLYRPDRCVSELSRLLVPCSERTGSRASAALVSTLDRCSYARRWPIRGDDGRPAHERGVLPAPTVVDSASDSAQGPVTIIVDSHETRTTTQAAEPTATNEKAEAKAQRRAEAEARTAKNKEAKKES